MLIASFSSFDVIAASSDAYRRRLIELGVASERIRRVRWGVDVHRFTPPTPDERESAKVRLGIEPGRFVVLWTGFTQQTDEADLRTALRIATFVLPKGRFAFVFCFKPEHFKDAFRRFERPGLQIVSSAETFQAARTAADVFLCPIGNAQSTAAPPLVWLECFAMGTPILTTAIPGTDEAVIEGESGFTVRSPEEAHDRLLQIEADSALQRRLRDGARRVAVERFSVDRAMDEYVEIWSALVDH